MNPPLLEVVLELNYKQIELSEERVSYFYRANADVLPNAKGKDERAAACFASVDDNESVILCADQIELRSLHGVSLPRLRSQWGKILASFFDIFGISELHEISLSYLNEIPLQDLRSFRDYLNLSFEMPTTLKERVEFFRSEFTYKYPFGQIKVWLQPDWDDAMENYCIQLNLESLNRGPIASADILGRLQELHDGIKDVFRQVLAEDYIRQLPQ